MSGAERRPFAVPLIMALVFLAIIGASVGVVAGLTRGDDDGNDQGSDLAGYQSPSPDAATGSPASPEPGGPLSPAGVGCLETTASAARRAGAKGELVRVLYLQAYEAGRSSRKIEVWICQDEAGRLFYQGHEGTPDDRGFSATSDRSLFLSSVQARDGGFEAKNGDTAYRARCDDFRIARSRGTTRFTVTTCEK
jgi:hypothetical protein